MAQTVNKSAGRKLTGKKCGQVFDVVADAKLVDIARHIEAANKLDRLGGTLREAEIFAAATADELETVRGTKAEAELLAARAAANKAYATIQMHLEQLLATTEEVLRQLDRILSSSG